MENLINIVAIKGHHYDDVTVLRTNATEEQVEKVLRMEKKAYEEGDRFFMDDGFKTVGATYDVVDGHSSTNGYLDWVKENYPTAKYYDLDDDI